MILNGPVGVGALEVDLRARGQQHDVVHVVPVLLRNLAVLSRRPVGESAGVHSKVRPAFANAFDKVSKLDQILSAKVLITNELALGHRGDVVVASHNHTGAVSLIPPGSKSFCDHSIPRDGTEGQVDVVDMQSVVEQRERRVQDILLHSSIEISGPEYDAPVIINVSGRIHPEAGLFRINQSKRLLCQQGSAERGTALLKADHNTVAVLEQSKHRLDDGSFAAVLMIARCEGKSLQTHLSRDTIEPARERAAGQGLPIEIGYRRGPENIVGHKQELATLEGDLLGMRLVIGCTAELGADRRIQLQTLSDVGELLCADERHSFCCCCTWVSGVV